MIKNFWYVFKNIIATVLLNLECLIAFLWFS